ncbi:MAG: hypothetical protein H6719_32915 [Sandaracinaceae bacterium]|nr:hypothetical protein [Sandaracinaceae bacterium]
MRCELVLGLGVAALLGVAAPARADRAPRRPASLSCPAGAIGRLAGDGPTRRPVCVPTTCASDADCSEGRVCSTDDVDLCVADEEGARVARPGGCMPGDRCLDDAATCERARRCLVPEAVPEAVLRPVVPVTPAVETAPVSEPPAAALATDPPGASSSACGCRAVGRGRSAPLVVALMLLLVRRRA